ncbi:MAG: SH3 domain-containing protein, partial [Anaerolineae bacterium]|nr:SH3 domain-containing protein [Anaerolineae bacterium]
MPYRSYNDAVVETVFKLRRESLPVQRLALVCAAALLGLAACTAGTSEEAAVAPTLTLAPPVSRTPRFTATPVPTRTPLPTFTFTPSNTPITPTPSDTPTPSPTPPITGIVASLETVNVREGPGVTFRAIEALVPGTGVEILAENEDGRWLNVKMPEGREGWISASLVRLNPRPTDVPTATPSPDMTAMALGTILPTALFGGGTITPTPPGFIVTATPPGVAVEATATEFQLPIVNVQTINETATALAGGIAVPQFTPTFTPVDVSALPTVSTIALPTFNPSVTPATPIPTTEGGVGGEGNTGSQQGVDVLAYCSNPVFGRPAPTNLLSGATIDVFWSWYVAEEDLIQQHLDHVIYEVRVDRQLLENSRLYGTTVRKQSDGNYYKY